MVQSHEKRRALLTLSSGVTMTLLMLSSCAGAQQGDGEERCDSESGCLRRCDDGDMPACHDLGSLLESENRFDEAADAFRRACDSGSVEACARAVRALQTGGREGEAEAIIAESCGEASELQHDLCRLLAEHVDASEADRDVSDAEGLYARRCDEGDAIACREYGRALLARGRDEEALVRLRRSCEAGDLDGCLGWGDAAERLGRAEEAQRARQRADSLGATD